MKTRLLVLLLGFTVTQLQAQKSDSKIAFNVGGELALATGNLNAAYSLGLGATAQLEYTVDEKITAYLNSGILQYVGKKIPGTTTKQRNTAVFPILGGAKYNFAKNFYGSAALGVSVFSGAGQSSKFTYIPGLGFKANEKIDVLFKYTGYANAGGAFGVRVSYAL